MRSFLLAAMISVIPAPVLASDVGVTVSIGQPGFYGQITLGNQYPVPPQLLYPNPVLALPPPAAAVQQPPIYLYVPPGHAKRWDKYCHRYNACYQPVYFVEKDWYNNVYVPHYHSQGGYPGGYHDAGHHHDDDDRAERRDHDYRPGRGNGGNHDRGDRGDYGKKGHDWGGRKD